MVYDLDHYCYLVFPGIEGWSPCFYIVCTGALILNTGSTLLESVFVGDRVVRIGGEKGLLMLVDVVKHVHQTCYNHFKGL